MKKNKIFTVILVLLLTASCVFARGSGERSASGPRKIRVAHTQSYFPYDYINERGQSDGFEVAVLRAADALIPEYEFEFIGTSDDDLLIGVETGKYAMGVKGAWLTEERRKKFIIPETPIAASIIGIAFMLNRRTVGVVTPSGRELTSLLSSTCASLTALSISVP